MLKLRYHLNHMFIPKQLCVRHMADLSKCLSGKVAVITGGAVGIGYDIADKFLRRGLGLVYLLDLNEQKGLQAMQKLQAAHGQSRVAFYKCDVTSDVNYVLDEIMRCCRIDILVNNAGLLDEDVPKKVIDINVTGTILPALQIWNYMRADKGGFGGTIINLASIYGFRVDPFFPVYKATKYAMMGFTKCLGHPVNYQRTCVRVFAINPGFTKTDMTSKPKLWDNSPAFYDQFKIYVSKQIWQDVGAVGDATVEAFEHCDSGTCWLIEGGLPITSV